METSNIISNIKDLRISCDGLAQLTKELKPLQLPEPRYYFTDSNNNSFSNKMEIDLIKGNSKEIEKAADNLYLAKVWLGKLLGELGEENPYKSGKKTVQDIEPTADTSNLNGGGTIHNFNMLKSHIQKVDWLRSSIENLVQKVIKLDLKGSRELAIARTNSYNHLCESKFQLGFELKRIRDSNNGTKN